MPTHRVTAIEVEAGESTHLEEGQLSLGHSVLPRQQLLLLLRLTS